MNSYSQHGEDLIIQQFFPEKYNGVCIEVGAVDGFEISNTLYFEKKGWFCICCEANPTMYDKLKVNRLESIHGAIGSEDLLEVEFNIVNLASKENSESAISAVTIDQRLFNQLKYLQPEIRKVNVPMFTLNTIMLKYPLVTHIDFISIDTEGTELEVLKGFDINRWQPTLFLIENNHNDPEIEEYLQGFGYVKERRLAVNDFYIKR